MHAFILAGGFATRLWPLTERRAKPLLPLAGLPIVSHLLRGIPRHLPVTVSTNAAFGEDFDHWRVRENHPNLRVQVEQTTSDDHKLGALGAVAQWVENEGVNDDVLLLTGDNYLGFPLTQFLETYRPGVPLLAAYDLADLETAKAFGTVVLGDDSRVAAFEEKPTAPKSTLVSTGCFILPAATLPVVIEHAQKHPDNVGGIFEALLERNWEVHAYTFRDPWFDIGSFGAYLEATAALVGEGVVQGDDVIVERSTLTGSVVLGDRTQVRECQLTNVVAFEDCILEDCVLEDCILDRGCRLCGVDLRGKMLREGTTIVRP